MKEEGIAKSLRAFAVARPRCVILARSTSSSSFHSEEEGIAKSLRAFAVARPRCVILARSTSSSSFHYEEEVGR